jgi:hypothetical protein
MQTLRPPVVSIQAGFNVLQTRHGGISHRPPAGLPSAPASTRPDRHFSTATDRVSGVGPFQADIRPARLGWGHFRPPVWWVHFKASQPACRSRDDRRPRKIMKMCRHHGPARPCRIVSARVFPVRAWASPRGGRRGRRCRCRRCSRSRGPRGGRRASRPCGPAAVRSSMHDIDEMARDTACWRDRSSGPPSRGSRGGGRPGGEYFGHESCCRLAHGVG